MRSTPNHPVSNLVCRLIIASPSLRTANSLKGLWLRHVTNEAASLGPSALAYILVSVTGSDRLKFVVLLL